VLAVCSCTIMPLFASIYKKGAGLGPAVTFLFVGPAINILAISFTGVQIGMDIAVARIVLSIIFGIGIGLLMAWFFRQSDASRAETRGSGAFSTGAKVPSRTIVFFALLLGMLIAGTLQVSALTGSFLTFTIPGDWANSAQGWLDGAIPPNAAMGIEGVSVHGVLLIVLLAAIAITAWLGLNRIDEGFNIWTTVALVLISLTLVIASVSVSSVSAGLAIGLTGRLIAEVVLIGAVWWVAARSFELYEIQEWLWETWRFVKQIIPLLLVGVFLAGVARVIIPRAWIESLAGENTLWANLIGVLFGVFMYFPTLVEVPIAQTFLSLGMHRGPLLAYLLADPALSIQSILITNSVIGRSQTAAYVVLVTIFSTLSGWLFGAWVDGVNSWLILALLLAGGGMLVAVASLLNRRSDRRSALSETA
jgi:uncharacterized membrane protein YraQ (UPF0718 family)